MRLELRNISYRLSRDDTNRYPPFQADLYIDSQLTAKVISEGYGSATTCEPLDLATEERIKDAELYCSRMDPITYPQRDMYDHSGFTMQATLLTVIDKMFNKHLNEQEFIDVQQMQKRHMNNILMWGRGLNGFAFCTLAVPLGKLLANPAGPEIIRDALMKILPRLRPCDKILNNNIPEEILQSAGFRAGQYTDPLTRLKSPAKQRMPQKRGKGL